MNQETFDRIRHDLTRLIAEEPQVPIGDHVRTIVEVYAEMVLPEGALPVVRGQLSLIWGDLPQEQRDRAIAHELQLHGNDPHAHLPRFSIAMHLGIAAARDLPDSII